MLVTPSYPSRTWVRLSAALLGLVLGAALGLWHAPSSNWLVRVQGSLAVPTHLAQGTLPELSPFAAGGARTPESEAAFHRAAVALSGDAMASVAYAVRDLPNPELDPSRGGVLSVLTPLTQRFPNDPAVIAAALRYAAGASGGLHRGELIGLSNTLDIRKTRSFEAARRAEAPADIAAYIRLAAAGERLDPSNAFFPAMRATALYAAHRDAEARVALARAASLPRWNEYIGDEVNGSWRLGDRALGAGNTMVRAGLLASVSFSHYGVLRDAAKLASLQAMKAEQAGRVREGLQRRWDILRLGAVMRAQCTTFVGAMMAAAMQDTAISRPAGMASARGKNAVSSRRAAFLTFLARNSRAGDSAWTRAQFNARDEIWRVERASFDRFDISRGLAAFGRWVVAGLVFLDSALWVIFFGISSAVLVRFAMRSRAGNASTPPSPGVPIAALVLAALLTLGVVWLGRGFAAVDALLSRNVPTPYTAGETAPGLASLGLVAALSLGLILAAVARFHRQPIIATVLRRYAAWSLPVACALLLVYGGIAVKTARMGAAINRSLHQIVAHEGRFYADLAGKQWPE